MYRLYGYPTMNSLKTLYVLEELGLEYDFNFINLGAGGQNTEDFKKISPVGKVPVLQHDDKALFESGAICRYLANVENSPLYPADPYARAQVDQWMDFFSVHLGRWLSTLYFEQIIKLKFFGNPADSKACEEAEKYAAQHFAVIEYQLTHQRYLTGNALTIADLFAYAYVEQINAYNLPIAAFPHVQKWLDIVSALPSIKRANEKAKQ